MNHEHSMTIEDAIQTLKEGNTRFTEGLIRSSKQDRAARSNPNQIQDPFAIILTCSDSCVVPEFVFDARIGDFYVVRVAGNVPSAEAIASIEFAVSNLNPKVILILAHEQCDAIAATIARDNISVNFNQLMTHILPALAEIESDKTEDIAKLNAKHSSQTLCKLSSVISDAVAEERIGIVTGYYRLSSGQVDFE